METLGSLHDDKRLVYGEKTEDIENIKLYSYYLTVQPNGNESSLLHIEVFLEFKEIDPLKKQDILKNIKRAWKESISCLKEEILNKTS